MATQSDERLRLLSICAGAGVSSSVFENTQYFKSVMDIEFEDDSALNLKHNFPHSFLFNGDLRDAHEVAEADVVNCTLPCNEHSSLGHNKGQLFDNLVLAAHKIIVSSKAKAVFIENVPQFFKSK